MTETVSSTGTSESVADFAARARTWLAANMPRVDPDDPPYAVRAEAESWDRAKQLQNRPYEDGFAGICFPREYGGRGLDHSYQKSIDADCHGYE